MAITRAPAHESGAAQALSGIRPSGGATVVRGISFQGAAARMWLARRGWRAAESANDPRLLADEFLAGDLQIRRISLSTAALTLVPTAAAGEALRAVHVVEGAAHIESNGWEARVPQGDLVVFRTNQHLSVHSPSTLTVSVVDMEIARAATGEIARFAPVHIEADRYHSRVYSSLVNAVMSADAGPQQPATSLLAVAIENSLIAVLASRRNRRESEALPDIGTRLGWTFRQEALLFVAVHYADPTFGVARLAAYMDCSRRSLERRLRFAGTSPGALIRDFRLEKAESLLRGAGAAGRSRQSIAKACGFGTARRLSRAFAERSGESTPNAGVAMRI